MLSKCERDANQERIGFLCLLETIEGSAQNAAVDKFLEVLFIVTDLLNKKQL